MPTNANTQRELNGGKIIKGLLIASIACISLNIIIGMMIDFEYILPYGVMCLSSIIALILFSLYIFKFYNNSSEEFLISIIFGVLVFHVGSNLINLLGLYGSIKNREKKFLFIIPVAVNLLSAVLAFGGGIPPKYAYSSILIFIGTVMFHIAMLIFVSKNTIQPVSFPAPKPKSGTEIEEELKILKYKLELGIITEEEYEEKRNEIINNI